MTDNLTILPAAILTSAAGIHFIDYMIVVASILLAIGMGVYFAHRQKDTSTYFTGSGKVPVWAVGMSIFATLISSPIPVRHTAATGFCLSRD